MKTNELIRRGFLAGLLALGAPLTALAAPADGGGGLHIHPVFMGGEPPPPGSIVGGGNLQAIFEAAAKRWERVFSKGPKWDITIEYEWAELTGVWYGQAKLKAQGGNPIRPTSAFVQFRSGATPDDGAYDWFADPTPEDNSHYDHYESVVGEVLNGPPDFVPIGEVNIGRVLSTETGPAAGRIDLLTVAMHEIGHALGLDENYAGNRAQCPGDGVRITPPRPFAGIFFLLAQCTHMEGFPPLPLMVTLPTPGWRNLISAADALAIAQVTSFPRPDVDEPPGVPRVQELHCCRLVVGSAPATLPVPDIVE